MAKANAEPLTERKLDTGRPAGGKTRIRLATAADAEVLAEFAAMAEAPFERQVREALVAGTAGASLRVALREGHRPYAYYMAQKFVEHGEEPFLAYNYGALLLVAEHRTEGAVGALLAYPPASAMVSILDRMEQAGYPEQEIHKTLVGAGTYFTRIKIIAVTEPARGRGIGASLLKRAKQVYDTCGFRTIYGAMPEGRGLEAFYRRAGFTVHDPGQPLDLSLLFGIDGHIRPGPGERLFSRDRPS